jgi:hypothetical protein
LAALRKIAVCKEVNVGSHRKRHSGHEDESGVADDRPVRIPEVPTALDSGGCNTKNANGPAVNEYLA